MRPGREETPTTILEDKKSETRVTRAKVAITNSEDGEMEDEESSDNNTDPPQNGPRSWKQRLRTWWKDTTELPAAKQRKTRR